MLVIRLPLTVLRSPNMNQIPAKDTVKATSDMHFHRFLTSSFIPAIDGRRVCWRSFSCAPPGRCLTFRPLRLFALRLRPATRNIVMNRFYQSSCGGTDNVFSVKWAGRPAGAPRPGRPVG